MLSTALFCLTIIIPALGDIRLVNMTTDEIHIIGNRDVETLLIISMCLLVIDDGNRSLEEDKFKITVGLLLPGDQDTLGEQEELPLVYTQV